MDKKIRKPPTGKPETPRRFSGEELGEPEKNFRALAQFSPVGLFLKDLHGHCICGNPKCAELAGLSPEECQSLDCATFIHPDDQERVVLEKTKAAEKRRMFHQEYRWVHRDGTVVHTLGLISPVTGPDGDIEVFAGTLVDITGRKVAEERIGNLQRLYRVANRINHAIVQLHNPLELFCEVCRTAVEDGGFQMAWVGMPDEREELVKVVASSDVTSDYLETINIILGKGPRGEGPTGTALREGRYVICNRIADDPRMAPWRESALRYGFGSSAAFPLETQDKTRGVINFYSVEPDFFNDEEVELLLGAVCNISLALERGRKEVEIDTLNERLLRAQRFAGLGFIDWNLKTDELVLSEEIYHIFGIKKGKRRATTALLASTIHPDDRKRVRDKLGEAASGKNEYDYEHRVLRPDGSVCWVRAQAIPVVRDEHGKPQTLFGTVLDITAKKEAEDRHLAIEEQLRQSQKMEAVGRLAGGVAHDFNNMLTVITGFTELALSEIDHSDPLFRILSQIDKAARRSSILTKQLLAFSRQQVISPNPIDLNLKIADTIGMLQRLVGEDISFTLIPGDCLWTVYLDPVQVDQILTNLAVNSRDAIQDTGNIIVETSNISLDESYSDSRPDFSPGDYVMITFTDDGCGMTMEVAGKIFEPFFTTKEHGVGTGLGLSTVYGIVRQNGGFINVYSEPGEGTTFKIYFPRFKSTPHVIKESAEPESITGSETILVVEDEEQILSFIQEALEIHGYHVLGTEKPEEAIELCEKQGGGIDLLLSDVVMPAMNGKELAERIKTIIPGIKTIFMSGYTVNVVAHRSILDEGVNFIQKPFDVKTLGIAIREVLDSPT